MSADILSNRLSAGATAAVCEQSGPKLYVDASAIRYNFTEICKAVGPAVEAMPVLKADAYGLGVENVAHIFGACKHAAVADCAEACKLQKLLPDSKILILYQPDAADAGMIAEHGFISGACSMEYLRVLNGFAAEYGKILSVHISIDSGAGRLGVRPDGCREFAREMLALKNIRVEGMFTHFSCADSELASDMEYTSFQISEFNRGVSEFESVYGQVKYKHACSSGGIFLHPEARFNMVRPGYILYGYYPSPEIEKFINLRPCIRLAAKIIYIKDVPENTSVSYGRKFISKRKSRIATVSIGYSDGLHRSLSNGGCFVVNGQRAPIAGTVCMDMIMLDVTDIKGEINIGDQVFVFDNDVITLDDTAEWCSTIGYEVLSHIESCVPRYIIPE